jgi:GT2 family glycosyltransferase
MTQPPIKPVLSIVVVNWNTKQLLNQCVQSIFDTIGALSHEILVVDNCSTDDSTTLLRANFPQVTIIAAGSNRGFSKAANLAMRQARGDFVLVAHPDVSFQDGAIHELLRFLQNHEQTGIVGANLVYPDGTFNTAALTRRNLRRELLDFGFPLDRIVGGFTEIYRHVFKRPCAALYWDHRTTVETAAVWNACMMFKRAVFAEIGPFDERYFVWFADTDWCYRARKAGWQIKYVAPALVKHYEYQSGSFLEGALVRYKVENYYVVDCMRRDLGVLYRKHFGSVYRHIAMCLRQLYGMKARSLAAFGKWRSRGTPMPTVGGSQSRKPDPLRTAS